MKELAVIIPTKNEAKTIPYLIRSIREQNFKDLEIIVADHPCSTDKTKEVAKYYGCLVTDGGTASEGRNRGADLAVNEKFEYLAWIDADVILPSRDFLEKALNEFRNRGLDLAGTIQKPYDSKTEIDLNRIFETCKRSNDWKCNALYEIVNLSLKISQMSKEHPCMQQCIFARRKLYNYFGRFNEELNFGEDSDYSERAVKAGYRFGILEDCGKVFTSTRRFEGKFWKVVFNQAKLNWERFHGKKQLHGGKKDYFDL